MHLIPTCQRATVDLVGTGDQVEIQKDDCLERVGTTSASLVVNNYVWGGEYSRC